MPLVLCGLLALPAVAQEALKLPDGWKKKGDDCSCVHINGPSEAGHFFIPTGVEGETLGFKSCLSFRNDLTTQIEGNNPYEFASGEVVTIHRLIVIGGRNKPNRRVVLKCDNAGSVVRDRRIPSTYKPGDYVIWLQTNAEPEKRLYYQPDGRRIEQVYQPEFRMNFLE